MAENRRDAFSMSLFIEGGAARLRIAETDSPARDSHEEQYPLSRHPMRLRSHTRTSSSVSGQSGSGLPGQQATTAPVSQEEAVENLSEATTEIQSIRENLYGVSEISRPTSPEENAEGPFLSQSSSPVRNDFRIWESIGPTESNFTIWEDPPNIETPLALSQPGWASIEDDKENTYATLSDYDSPAEEESLFQPTDWVTIDPGPRDVFGLPIQTPTRPTVHGLAGAGLVTPVVVPQMPTATETIARPAIRFVVRDEEELDDEWDDSLSANQIRELQELNDIYVRGAEHRRLYGRQVPMRDSNGQGQANVFLEARRVTEFQRHEGRRRSDGDVDED